MKSIQSLLLALVWGLLFGGYGYSQSTPQVFKGAQIIPISGEPINNGILIVENGKIVTVGDANTRIPRKADIHDVSGKVIMPGLVDSHSHIGEGDGGDRSAAMHPDVRIMDAIDPRSDTFRKALAGGISCEKITINVIKNSPDNVAFSESTILPPNQRIIEIKMAPINSLKGEAKACLL